MTRWLLIFFALLPLQGCQSFVDAYHKNQAESSPDPDVQKAMQDSTQELLEGGQPYRVLPDGCKQYLDDDRVVC